MSVFLSDLLSRWSELEIELPHDVADYPALGKRIYRNVGMAWNLVNVGDVEEPQGGRKI